MIKLISDCIDYRTIRRIGDKEAFGEELTLKDKRDYYYAKEGIRGRERNKLGDLRAERHANQFWNSLREKYEYKEYSAN